MPFVLRCPHWLPFFWFGAIAVTYRPFILLDKSYWDTLDDDRRDMLMKHEHIHYVQERNPLYFPRYIFSKEWRMKYELEAYRINIRYYMLQGYKKSWIINEFGSILSGETYWHMASYATACYKVAEIISEFEGAHNAHV